MRLRRLVRGIVSATPLPEVLLRYREKRHVTILGYHRIAPPPTKDYPFNEGVFSATPEEFARELKYLRANLDMISIPEFLRGLHDPSLLPPRPALITFDDGYADNYTIAFPLLREAQLPACFFLCTGLVGQSRVPWQEAWVCCLKRSTSKRIDSPFGPDDPPYELDEPHRAASIVRFRQQMRVVPWSQVPALLARLSAMTGINPSEQLAQPMFMSWDNVREMAAGGMEFGGHTRTHPVLSHVDDDNVLEDEIAGCYNDLLRQLSRRPVAFAYPFGSADHMCDRADACIERAGFKLSFSFIHGFAPRTNGSTYRLPRIHASHGDDHCAFRIWTATAPA